MTTVMETLDEAPSRWLWFTAILIAVALIACTSATEPDFVYELAMVESVELPYSVAVAEPFDLTIVTLGRHTCYQRGFVHVERTESDYLVIPYVMLNNTFIACGHAMPRFEHIVPFAIAEAGTTQISIRHRLLTKTGDDSIATMIREVVVVPPR